MLQAKEMAKVEPDEITGRAGEGLAAPKLQTDATTAQLHSPRLELCELTDQG